ncbi:hypothetical protein KCP73_14520 [Salmonella enterica subsp. enterica]|nr:hypothetical protein KCP73_14520 [Salmonella enterica subsp. enterica]
MYLQAAKAAGCPSVGLTYGCNYGGKQSLWRGRGHCLDGLTIFCPRGLRDVRK